MSIILPRSVDITSEKLLRALDCLLAENFTIQDKTLLEKLLTSLNRADFLLQTIPTSTHCKWFSSVLEIYQRQTAISKNSSIHLYAFALKYLAILIKSNNGLVIFIESHTLQSMINQIDVASNLKESSIFNAYMTLLQILNTHKRGIEYVFQEGLWKNILFAIHGLVVPAKYVEIQSSQYIADLIYKSFKYDMVHHCEPLLEELFSNLGSTDDLITNQQVKEFFAYNVYVKTLILSLEKFIGTKYESDACQKIVYKYSLSNVLISIQKLLNITPILLKNYMTLQLLLDCFTFWHHSDMECILKSFFTHMNMPKDIQSYQQINNSYTQAIKYANISNAQLANNTVFEKELIVGQLTPLRKCTEWLKCSQHEKSNFEGSCIIESKSILSYCNNHDSMINELAISSILNILDVVPILKQESLDYLIKFFSTLTDQFLYSDNWTEPHQDRDSVYYKFLNILSYVFICWTKVLECKMFVEYNMCISLSVPLVHRHSLFFQKSSHSSTLLQNGLKLISTALNKRFHVSVLHAENLIAFDNLCTTLNNLLLDTRPEIRDSCLQCISSIIIASKYNSGHFIIELLLEKKLPMAVLNTLKYDKDPFVKSKALECLDNMVSILDIWEKSLKDSDLMIHCFNLMQCESEGIIRRQIVKLITALSSHNNLSYKLFNEICTVMVHISVKDPLWEVKIFTYEFWSSVIQTCIKTSCKLNNSKQLNNDLVKLSETGCLHVLYMALKEEHDLAVQKKAILLTLEILASINFTNDNSTIDFKPKSGSFICPSSIKENVEHLTGSKQKKSRQIDSSDRVLNSITTTSDCELLPSLKSTSTNNIYPNNTCLSQKTDSYISIDEFLNFTSTYDFGDCDAKSQWVLFTRSGLDSMLDDIIGQSENCFVEGADLLDCH